MKTLILSCNTGEGHNSCAKAIQEYYEIQKEACDIKDALSFISLSASEFIAKWHVRMYRYFPVVFRKGYDYFEKHPDLFRENSGIYRMLTAGTERLYQFICEGSYDAVICTHVFSSLMLTAVRKKYGLTVAGGFVATDYTCSPSVKDSELDYYFIPDDCLAEEFLTPVITREKLIGCGIPIRQMFYQRMEKAAAKRYFNLPEDGRHLLLMCGSMGCGPMECLVEALAGRFSEQVTITVLCGTNISLQERLTEQYHDKENIHVRGFVEDISLLMDSADLYLTKPGGLSVSEAVMKDLPMVFVDAVAGCEAYNGRFFLERGCARTAKTEEELAQLCVELLEDEESCELMRRQLAAVKKDNASEQIFTYMKACVGN